MPEIECVVGTLTAQPRFFCLRDTGKEHAAFRGALLLFLALLCTTAFAQTQPSLTPQTAAHYRLSGIIANEKGNSIAVIELPNGKTAMVHEGEAFENGRILEISVKSMLVRYPQGDRRYWLASDGLNVTDHQPANDELLPVIAKSESGRALLRTLAKAPVVTRLDQLITAGRAKTGTLNELLGPLFDLPKQANIVEIDHQPLGPTLESVTSIREALARGNVVSLGIEGYPGKQMMYLMPKSDNADGPKE